MLLVGETFYHQADGAPLTPGGAAFPYPDHPLERTTWKAWREAHPETDVYLGINPPARPVPRQPGA